MLSPTLPSCPEKSLEPWNELKTSSEPLVSFPLIFCELSPRDRGSASSLTGKSQFEDGTKSEATILLGRAALMNCGVGCEFHQ